MKKFIKYLMSTPKYDLVFQLNNKAEILLNTLPIDWDNYIEQEDLIKLTQTYGVTPKINNILEDELPMSADKHDNSLYVEPTNAFRQIVITYQNKIWISQTFQYLSVNHQLCYHLFKLTKNDLVNFLQAHKINTKKQFLKTFTNMGMPTILAQILVQSIKVKNPYLEHIEYNNSILEEIFKNKINNVKQILIKKILKPVP